MANPGLNPRWRFRLHTKATLLGLLLLGLVVLTGALYFGAYRGFSAGGFEETIQSWGAWGVFGSIGLMILHSFVPFPAEFLAMANGMVYGLLWGTVITWTGAMLGAYLAFGLARAPWAGRSSRRWCRGSAGTSWMNGRPREARISCFSAASYRSLRSTWSITPLV